MRQAVIATALVLACACLSVSASYFLFGRRSKEISDLKTRMIAAGILIQDDGSDIRALDTRVDAVSSKLDKVTNYTSQALDGFKGAGLLDSHWWCWQLRCTRDEQSCATSIIQAEVEANRQGRVNIAQSMLTMSCYRTRTAYCDSNVCFPDLATCDEQTLASKDICVGVE